MGIQEEKTELHKKVHRRICVSHITFLAARLPSYVIIFVIFLPTSVIRRKQICFFPENDGGGMAHPVTPVSTALLGKTIILDYSYYGLFSSLSDL